MRRIEIAVVLGNVVVERADIRFEAHLADFRRCGPGVPSHQAGGQWAAGCNIYGMPADPYITALRGPILVTGASGFVGANLFKMLARERSDVFAVEKRGKSWRLADVNNELVVAVDLT